MDRVWDFLLWARETLTGWQWMYVTPYAAALGVVLSLPAVLALELARAVIESILFIRDEVRRVTS